MRRTRVLALGAGGAALLGGGVAVRQALGLEWSAESVRALVDGAGLWGPLVYVLLVGFRHALLVPSQLVLMAGGVCFGALEGAAYGAVGMTLSGVIIFLLTRWLGPEAMRSRVPPRMHAALDLAGSRMGGTFLAVAVAYPVGPLTAYFVGAALAGMALPTFVLAVGGGAAVRSASFAWFGSSLAEQNTAGLVLAAAFLGLAFAIPLLFPASRRWLLARLAAANPSASDSHLEEREGR
jgi:uncharacterized membrane protein YdjX (TVP38/TMEM64 family)